MTSIETTNVPNRAESRVLAIVPAYNEEESLVATIEELQRVAPDIDYVVVNDGSRDGTLALCKASGFNYVSHPTNLALPLASRRA